MKEKRKATGGVVREVKGNLRFPLDKTYHGCPAFHPITVADGAVTGFVGDVPFVVELVAAATEGGAVLPGGEPAVGVVAVVGDDVVGQAGFENRKSSLTPLGSFFVLYQANITPVGQAFKSPDQPQGKCCAS